MTEFYVGDRVQVLAKRTAAPHAGRAGEVVLVARTFSGGPPVSYQVRLDAGPTGPAPATHATFAPAALGPGPAR